MFDAKCIRLFIALFFQALLESVSSDFEQQKDIFERDQNFRSLISEAQSEADALRSESVEIHILGLEHMCMNVLSEACKDLKKLMKKAELPVKHVLPSEELCVPETFNCCKKLKEKLEETLEQLRNQVRLDMLKTKIGLLEEKVRAAEDEAEKVYEKANVTCEDLMNALELLGSSKDDMDTLAKSCEELNEISEELSTASDDESECIRKIGERFDRLQEMLIEDLNVLKSFDMIAVQVDKKLTDLENSCSEIERAETSDVAIEDLMKENEAIRRPLKQLDKLRAKLSSLQQPSLVLDSLNIRYLELNKKLTDLRDEIEHRAEEDSTEKVLRELLKSFEDALLDADEQLATLELIPEAVTSFKGEVLPTVLEKCSRFYEQKITLEEDRFADLYKYADQLKESCKSLSARVDEKLDEAKRREHLINSVRQAFERTRERLTLLNLRYKNLQSLAVASEDLMELKELLVGMPYEEISKFSDLKERYLFEKEASQLKAEIRRLQAPLEAQIARIKDLLHDVQTAESMLSDIEDRVPTLLDSKPNIGKDEELLMITELIEELRRLKMKLESLHAISQTPAELVSHEPFDENNFARIATLLEKLDALKRMVMEQIKLLSLEPILDSITEAVQNHAYDLEQHPARTVDEHKITLQDLETKKYQLEDLVEQIPLEDAGNELRERSAWQLGQINGLLQQLAEVVGERLAVLAAFTALGNEVKAQLESLKVLGSVVPSEATVPKLDERLQNIEVSVVIKLKLKTGF